jgi:hypothetical protein
VAVERGVWEGDEARHGVRPKEVERVWGLVLGFRVRVYGLGLGFRVGVRV